MIQISSINDIGCAMKFAGTLENSQHASVSYSRWKAYPRST